MNRNSPHRCWGRLIAILPALVLVIAGLACPAVSFGASAPLDNKVFSTDALVIVTSDPQGDDYVSIAYTTEISKEQLKADLAEIQKASGWKIEKVKSAVGSPGAGLPLTTSTEFHTLGVVDYKQGYLYVEPFVIALKRLREIDIQFLIPGEFSFKGLQDFSNDTVNVKFSRDGIQYIYSIELAKNDFQTLNLPKPHSNRALLWVGIIILALVAAAAAYWVSARYMKTRSA